jgi:short-subunit dehydrogenase
MKNIVITGSTRGVGLEMAKEFMRKGCQVTLSGRNEFNSKLEIELSEFKGKCHYVQCNVQVVEDIEQLWKRAKEKWGCIDYWVNNAGQNCPYETAYNTDVHYVDAVINTNLKGMIYGSNIAAKHMLEQGSGQIWNMEGLGSNDMIQEKTILYGTTKRALTYFTRGLAKEMSSTPVKVSRLSPGMMLTDFITKTPEGEVSPVLKDQKFQFVFNTLADKPDTVAMFLVEGMLKNTKNDAHVVWLTKSKAMKRFMLAPIKKRKLI